MPSLLRAIAALFLLTCLSGCDPSADRARGIALSAEKPVIPSPSPALRAPCKVPDLADDADAYAALSETRYELVTCSRKQRGLLAHIDLIQREFGRKPPK